MSTINEVINIGLTIFVLANIFWFHYCIDKLRCSVNEIDRSPGVDEIINQIKYLINSIAYLNSRMEALESDIVADKPKPKGKAGRPKSLGKIEVDALRPMVSNSDPFTLSAPNRKAGRPKKVVSGKNDNS